MTTLIPASPGDGVDEQLEPRGTGTGAGSIDAGAPPEGATPPRGHLVRLVRGREQDPAWVRPALLTLLSLTAVLYLWDLGASGWANSFYSAAVQAGTKSWKAFFFGSSDSSNFITVDKPPASLWVMEISGRIFGFNAWSMLVPQALEGVATVGLVYLTVRRWFSANAALLGGAVVALTPVAALMFRFNNPDALLALLLTGAIYATVRALEAAQTKWLLLAGTLVGFGFLTKMMQAFLIVPALGIVYLLAAPTPFWRRAWQVIVLGLTTLVAAGWWVAAVVLTPAADRPYVGGSQNNSILNLIFGYNGFGRLTGNEAGHVGGTNVGGSMWGPTGFTRLFNPQFGNMMSWLLPGALLMGAIVLLVTWRAKRTDHERAAFLLWGGCLAGTGLTISLAQGIIHPYYTVALAPPLGALVGMGTMSLWQRRASWVGRSALAGALVVTTVWGVVLLDRTPAWFPWLRVAMAVAGALGALAILALPWLRRMPNVAIVLVALLGFGAALAAPLFSTIATAATPHSGAIPSVTPTAAGGFGGPGGGFRGFGGGGLRRGGFPRGAFGGGTRGGPGGGGFTPPGGLGTGRGTGLPGGGFTPPAFARGGGGTFGGGVGGVGGILSSSTPGSAVTKLLQANAGSYSWVAAITNSNSAAGYQLASDDPVMAIGGFNGTDPAPSLAQFEKYVAEGKIHYYISAGGGFGGGFGGFGGSSSGTSDVATQISTWVESHFTAKTVDGTTLYNLTAPTTSS
jgi:4-amino-4-deoxy-L-arabinose transferase-like glycosyltransferase